MQGARTTRTSRPSLSGRSRRRCSAPAIAQESESQTRTVTGGRRRLVLLHDVEVSVEGRDLVDLGERELHLLRQRGEMRGGEIAVLVLDQMQMLDQQIAPALALAEQRTDLVERLWLDLRPLGVCRGRLRRPAPGACSSVLASMIEILLKPAMTAAID